MNTLLKKLTVCHKEKINMTYDNCFDLLNKLKIMFKEGKISLVGEPCLNKSNFLSFSKTKEQQDIEKVQILLSEHYKDINIISATFSLPCEQDSYLIKSLNIENINLENKFLISVNHENFQMNFSTNDTFSGFVYFMVDVEYIKEFELYINIFFKRLLEVNYEEFLENQKKEFMTKMAKKLLS